MISVLLFAFIFDLLIINDYYFASSNEQYNCTIYWINLYLIILNMKQEELKILPVHNQISKIEERNESSIDTDWNDDLFIIREESLNQAPPNFELAKVHGEASKVK